MFENDVVMKGYSGQNPFRYWCQKVLPLVYDESLSYYELLSKMMEYLNNAIEDIKNIGDNTNALYNSYQELINYVNTYFDSLDVTSEINSKLDKMATDGTLSNLLRYTISYVDPESGTSIVSSTIPPIVTSWLDDHLVVGEGEEPIVVDDTLTISEAAADSKTVGDTFDKFYNAINKPDLKWNNGYYVPDSGVYSTTPYWTVTDIIPCTPNDRIINNSPSKDSNDKNLTYYIIFYTYQNGEYIFSSRQLFGIVRDVTIPENIMGIRFMLGRTSAVPNRPEISATDKDYWDAKYYMQGASVNVERIVEALVNSSVTVYNSNVHSAIAGLPANTLVRTVNSVDKPTWVGEGTGFWVLTAKANTSYVQFGFNAVSGQLGTRWGYVDNPGNTPDNYSDWKTFNESAITANNDGNHNGSINNLKANTLQRCTQIPVEDRPTGVSLSTALWVFTTNAGTHWIQIAYLMTTGEFFTRRGEYNEGSVVYESWISNNKTNKELKVLCIGNSLTEDNMGYVPFIMKNIAPDVNLTLGILFHAGASIDDYYGWFTNPSSATALESPLKYEKSVNGSAWTVSIPVAGQTVQEVLLKENWDIITFQQASAYQGNINSFTNFLPLLQGVAEYCVSHGHKPPMFGWLMPQRNFNAVEGGTPATFQDIVNVITTVGALAPITFLIPCGTAIEDARTVAQLDALGSFESATYGNGHLLYDDTHLQEGLPCMIGAYTACLVLLDRMEINYVGILGENTRPNDTWIEDKNIQGVNGNCVGVTDANCYIAQRAAISAKNYDLTVIPITNTIPV